MSNKLLSHIFRFTLSLAFFLDAINVDALFTSHSMIREEYEGQCSEIYSSHNDKQVILHARFGTTGNRTFQPANNSTRRIYLIDEDSVSLAAQPAHTEEAALVLCRSIRIRHTAPHAPLFDFYSLCKLQI